MDYNHNYSYAYSDPPNFFDLDIINSTYHNFNQPIMLDWSFLNQYMPQSQYYERDMNNYHYSFTESMGIQLPESYYQPLFQHLCSNFSSHDQPIKEKYEVTKSIEAIIESQE